MRYTKEWKPNFRPWEVIFNGRKQLFSLAVLILLTALTPPVAFADDDQNLDAKSLESWVLHAYKGELESIAQSQDWPAYSVDANIRIPPSVVHLPRCESSMVIEGRDHHSLPIGNLKRAISCNDLVSPWRINVSIKSTVTLPIVFVNESVQRGETLKPSALSLKRHTLNKGYPFFTDLSDLQGLRALRRLKAGSMLNASHLESIPLIIKGDEVLLTASKGDFQASMKGVALEEGKKGDQIEVRNLSSNKIVRAVVTGKNTVETTF